MVKGIGQQKIQQAPLTQRTSSAEEKSGFAKVSGQFAHYHVQKIDDFTLFLTEKKGRDVALYQQTLEQLKMTANQVNVPYSTLSATNILQQYRIVKD